MARPRQDVTDAELAILELLWDRTTASTRQIVDALYPGGGAGRYATVQKQLERMEAKGLIHRDRSYFQHLFSPAVDREQLAGQRLRTVLDKLCEGSLVPLLSHLVRTRPLTPEERKALRELIERPEPRQRTPSRKPRKE
jgi:BlaI family transcriptional regulator, penicillinase repressor